MELRTTRPTLAKELFSTSEILRTYATTDEEDGTPGLVFVVARLGVEYAHRLESAIYCELVLDESHAVLNLVTCDGWLRAVTELQPNILHTVEALLDDRNPEILLGLVDLTDSTFIAPIRRRVVVRDYSTSRRRGRLMTHGDATTPRSSSRTRRSRSSSRGFARIGFWRIRSSS